MFYDDTIVVDHPVKTVEIFDTIDDLVKWKDEHALISKTKYIFPFCWQWKSRNSNSVNDITIDSFSRQWNPEDTDEQVIWLNDNTDDRVACIYTSQGLDMDNVAFVWWDDLVWDDVSKKWVGNITKLKDPAFRVLFDKRTCTWKQAKWDWAAKANIEVTGGFELSQDKIDLLIKNTYYVMLTRPRKKVGIWFKDESTKQHVKEILGIAK